MIPRCGRAPAPTPTRPRLRRRGRISALAGRVPSPAGGGGLGWGWNPGFTRFLSVAAVLLTLVLAAAPAHAVRPDEMLKDPVQEARAREVSKELRCLVC